jgi:hypothetical protein
LKEAIVAALLWTVAALLVDLAELLLQLRDHLFCAHLELIVGDPGKQISIFQNLHFKYYALVFVNGLTAWLRRERASLSVTDDCRVMLLNLLRIDGHL